MEAPLTCLRFHLQKLSSTFASPNCTSVALQSYRSLPWLLSPLRKSFTTLSRGKECSVPREATDAGSTVEYMPLEDVEKIERYRPGGFHPIAIGDHLHDRYLVVHKLGFGAYSTTWLARDQTARKYVAIKIAVAAGESRESKILHQLDLADMANEAHPGKAIINLILDEFILNGPNGKHRCFVTVPARMSLAVAKDASCIRLFQLSVARAIAAQLIQAVAFLHSRGIVHAGGHPRAPIGKLLRFVTLC
jgi:serine/threonine-protein kinase SRPK3